MGLKSDLESEVATIFKTSWTERDGTVIPTDASLKLGNDAVKLTAAVLYADLADSTKLVDGYTNQFAAEIFKTFLHCAAKIIKSYDGAVTAYDGDRVMAVFIGDAKNTKAAKAALNIKWAVDEIVRPAQLKQYPNSTYTLKHVCGIDTSDLYVARTGVRGANDLVWIGRAANYAAKLAAMPDSYSTYITKEVYNLLNDEVKVTSGKAMWEETKWTSFDGRSIYRSTWRRSFG